MTGCTVHFVAPAWTPARSLHSGVLEVRDGDTAETLHSGGSRGRNAFFIPKSLPPSFALGKFGSGSANYRLFRMS